MAKIKSISFPATFPPIQGAIKVSRDGARVHLDVPASEMQAILKLVALQSAECVLRVTIKVEDYGVDDDSGE